MEAAIGIITSHSESSSGTVRKSFCINGLYTTKSCKNIIVIVAPTKNLLENGFIWKIDFDSCRQFQALNH